MYACLLRPLCRFHDVVPQDGLPLLPPSQLSQLVVNRAKRTGGQLGVLRVAVAFRGLSCCCALRTSGLLLKSTTG